MTKSKFVDEFRREIIARYAWSADAKALSLFMTNVCETLNGDRKLAKLTGKAATAAWKAIGGKGKPTYKALRALPQ